MDMQCSHILMIRFSSASIYIHETRDDACVWYSLDSICVSASHGHRQAPLLSAPDILLLIREFLVIDHVKDWLFYFFCRHFIGGRRDNASCRWCRFHLVAVHARTAVVLDLLLVFLWRLTTNILTVIQTRTRLFIRHCLSRRHRGFVIAFALHIRDIFADYHPSFSTEGW